MSRIIHKKSLRSPEVEIPPILLASREEGCLVVHEKGALQFTGWEDWSLHCVWAQTRGAYPEHCNHTQIAFRLQISISKLSKMVWRLITNASKLFYFDPHRNAQWGGRQNVRLVCINARFLFYYIIETCIREHAFLSKGMDNVHERHVHVVQNWITKFISDVKLVVLFIHEYIPSIFWWVVAIWILSTYFDVSKKRCLLDNNTVITCSAFLLCIFGSQSYKSVSRYQTPLATFIFIGIMRPTLLSALKRLVVFLVSPY